MFIEKNVALLCLSEEDLSEWWGKRGQTSVFYCGARSPLPRTPYHACWSYPITVGASEDGIVAIAQLKFILYKRTNRFGDQGTYRGRTGLKQQESTTIGYTRLQYRYNRVQLHKSWATSAIRRYAVDFWWRRFTSARWPKLLKSTVSRPERQLSRHPFQGRVIRLKARHANTLGANQDQTCHSP